MSTVTKQTEWIENIKYPVKLWNCLEIQPELIVNTKFLNEEIKFVEKKDYRINYYKDIFLNRVLNEENLINSHIMFACGKVKKIKNNEPVKKIGEVYNLCDIDCDCPISFRQSIIDYLKNTYGSEKISYIIAFGRMDGRGAVKEVFRILKPCSDHNEVSNRITRLMVDTAKVQDQLEDLREKDPKYNIVRFNLDHVKEVADYYDEFKYVFDVAIKLASTIKTQGRHAAGIIVGQDDLSNHFPLLYDSKNGEPILAYEMEDAEYVGAVKYDILGVAAIEKVAIIQNMIKNKLKTPINIYDNKTNETVDK